MQASNRTVKTFHDMSDSSDYLIAITGGGYVNLCPVNVSRGVKLFTLSVEEAKAFVQKLRVVNPSAGRLNDTFTRFEPQGTEAKIYVRLANLGEPYREGVGLEFDDGETSLNIMLEARDCDAMACFILDGI